MAFRSMKEYLSQVVRNTMTRIYRWASMVAVVLEVAATMVTMRKEPEVEAREERFTLSPLPSRLKALSPPTVVSAAEMTTITMEVIESVVIMAVLVQWAESSSITAV